MYFTFCFKKSFLQNEPCIFEGREKWANFIQPNFYCHHESKKRSLQEPKSEICQNKSVECQNDYFKKNLFHWSFLSW